MDMATAALIERAVAKRRTTASDATIDGRTIASGAGWRILDVVCTCGSHDIVRDEQHSHYSLAMVLGGAFEYRGRGGAAHLPPGSILIGQAGNPFRCSHSYGAGDRCLAVQFEREAFEDLIQSLGLTDSHSLPVALPVLRSTAGLFAFSELYAGSRAPSFDGLDTAVRIAERILATAQDRTIEWPHPTAPHARRLLELARWLEQDPSAEHSVETLAANVGLSKFHFIRSFRKITGLPPYAFVSRVRLREASKAIASSDRRILDIVLESGFSDLSTFNHLFKRHYGQTPQEVRRRFAKGCPQPLLQA